MGSWQPLAGLTAIDSFPNCCCQCLCPCSEPQLPPPLQETLQYQQLGLAQCFMGSLLFPLGPGANETLCAPSSSGVCFPQSCGSPGIKPHWPSKPYCLGTFPPSSRPPPGWEAWCGTQEFRFCGILFSSLCITHLAGIGFNITMIAPLLRSCGFFFSLDSGDTFLVGSRVWGGVSRCSICPPMQELQEMGIWSLGWEDPLGEEMSTHSNILAGKIPWIEEPARLHSVRSQRVWHDWVTEHKQNFLTMIVQ